MSERHFCVCDWCRGKAESADDLGKGKWQPPDGWSYENPGAVGDLLCGTCAAALGEAIAKVAFERRSP